MKYVLLIYLEETALNESGREACYVKSASLAQELHSRGQFLATAPLHSVATATSIQVREGKRLVIDGPFAETREQLGGFFLIEAKNLDEAIRIAERIPGAQVGTVEIRPVVEVAGLPETSF
ncbi:MAG: YciI family protein [Acidobacteriota bacterium]